MSRYRLSTRASLTLLLSSLLFAPNSFADESDVEPAPAEAEAKAAVTEEAGSSQAEAPAPEQAEPTENGPQANTAPSAPAEASAMGATAKLSEDEQRARDAFRRGDQLYLEGDYSGAVKAFEEAYALSGRIEMLFNLANTFERLGNYSAASVALRGYIPHSPPAQRAALEKRLERFEQLAQDKELADENAHKASQEFPVRQTVGIGLLTLGGAALITGTAFAISDGKTRKNLDEICVEGELGRLCPEDAEMDLQQDKTYSIVADVSFAAGAILTAAGLYVVLHRSDETGEVRATATPGGFLIGGKF